MNTIAISTKTDAREYLDALALLTKFLEHFPKVGYCLVHLIRTTPKIVSVNVQDAATGTVDLRICFKPSHSLRMFCFALRTLNINLLVIKDSHGDTSQNG